MSGRYLQFRFLNWPLIWGMIPQFFKGHHSVPIAMPIQISLEPATREKKTKTVNLSDNEVITCYIHGSSLSQFK